MKKIRITREKNKSLTSRIVGKTAVVIGCIILALIVIAIAAVCAFFIMKSQGKHSMEDRRALEETLETDPAYDFDFDPLTERYNGKTYRYNENLTNFLVIGVDKDSGMGVKDGIAGSAGQSDVIILVSLDEKEKKVSLISIDRNTVCDVETFDSSGNSIGIAKRQLAYSYAFGDGLHKSCKLTSQAVSELMFGIPIHAYYSMVCAAVRDLNDAVGGVTVIVPVDMTSIDKAFIQGKTVTLNGDQAEGFLRARTSLEDPSNSARLSRQKIYVMAFIDAAIKAVKKDLSLPFELYKQIASNSCTDLDADEIVYLASLAPGLKINYYGIKGTTDASGSFDEFTPDYDALYELVLDIFYICED